MVNKKSLNEKQIEAIEKALTAGNRVELIPVKDGIRVMHITRQDIMSKNKNREIKPDSKR